MDITEMQKHLNYLRKEVEKARVVWTENHDEEMGFKIIQNDDWDKAMELRNATSLAYKKYQELTLERDNIHDLIYEYHKSQASKIATLGLGRPKIGIKRSISLTLPEDIWDEIDIKVKEDNSKLGTTVRDLVLVGLDRSGD